MECRKVCQLTAAGRRVPEMLRKPSAEGGSMGKNKDCVNSFSQN